MPETSFRNCGEAIHHKLNLTGSISLASPALFFKKKKKDLLTLFLAMVGLHGWVGFFLVAASGSSSLLLYVGFLQWLVLLQSTDSKHSGFSTCSVCAQ